jgi:trimethylamine--corrinoid protein Co-methyltransferase
VTFSIQPSLDEAQVKQIHNRSLHLLENVGIDYKTPRALEILEQAGCVVDYDRTWASIPRDLVDWALKQAPRVVQLEARDPSRNVILDGKRSHHTNDRLGPLAIICVMGTFPI